MIREIFKQNKKVIFVAFDTKGGVSNTEALTQHQNTFTERKSKQTKQCIVWFLYLLNFIPASRSKWIFPWWIPLSAIWRNYQQNYRYQKLQENYEKNQNKQNHALYDFCIYKILYQHHVANEYQTTFEICLNSFPGFAQHAWNWLQPTITCCFLHFVILFHVSSVSSVSPPVTSVAICITVCNQWDSSSASCTQTRLLSGKISMWHCLVMNIVTFEEEE